jgi:hypothetical protein
MQGLIFMPSDAWDIQPIKLLRTLSHLVKTTLCLRRKYTAPTGTNAHALVTFKAPVDCK